MNKKFSHTLALVLAFLFYGAKISNAQHTSPRHYAEAIATSREAIYAMMKSAKVPGVSVAVAMKGEVVWTQGFGSADLEKKTAATIETKFGIGSITKSFTMALFSRLVEEGKVDLDVPVENCLPQFPHKNQNISVRLIAGHLSGLGDDFNTAHAYSTTHYKNTAEALREIINEPLKYPPRMQHFYATSAYTIIAGIIEKVSGQDFLTALDHYVIKPLDLKNTVPNDRTAIIPNCTSFYVQNENGAIAKAPAFDPSYKMAGAGLLSTAAEVARFGAAFLRPGFLQQSTIDELFRALKTASGENTGFGLGWRIGADKKGRRIVHQPGGGPGISCWLYLYPQEDCAVAILANLTGAPVGGKTLETVAEAFLAATLKHDSN